MSHGHLIAPLALDLGASKTGVFTAIYTANTDLAAFSKSTSKTAFVADIDKNGYTLLQTGRTANRHAIRGRTRNKQAKKLLTLMLDAVYRFPVEKHREAISHLMNRRGFTYLESQIDNDKLDSLEAEIRDELIQELKGRGQTSVAELFESQALSDALNELVCHQATDLELTLTNLSAWVGRDKKRQSQIKPLQQALSFYIKDLTAGAKFRAKYFKAVKQDIRLMQRHPVKACRKLFFALGDYGKRHQVDMPSIFY